jgi:hypothetical protein
MSVRTFDPKKLIITYGGVPLSGFADGTFVTVERENDLFSKVSGTDGVVSRAKSNDRSGSCTVSLAQTSPSNDVLSGFYQLDEKANTGVLPLIGKDLSGRTVFASGNAWIRKPPPITAGKEIENRDWIIDCADLDMFIGGNGEL